MTDEATFCSAARIYLKATAPDDEPADVVLSGDDEPVVGQLAAVFWKRSSLMKAIGSRSSSIDICVPSAGRRPNSGRSRSATWKRSTRGVFAFTRQVLPGR